ncbi:hypothetical protein M4D79_16110 [Mycolicibacterium novocastrense]|nr:hypothetical protein M4D79_16110 [Mycolicibacterium novocastrense]
MARQASSSRPWFRRRRFAQQHRRFVHQHTPARVTRFGPRVTSAGFRSGRIADAFGAAILAVHADRGERNTVSRDVQRAGPTRSPSRNDADRRRYGDRVDDRSVACRSGIRRHPEQIGQFNRLAPSNDGEIIVRWRHADVGFAR